MNVQNLSQKVTMVDVMAMAAVAASQTSNSGVDMRAYNGEVAFILSCKNTAGTTPTLVIKLQESDAASSDFTDIAGAVFTTVTDANSLLAVKEKIAVNITATKRYVRTHVTIGGTNSPSFMTSIVAVAASGQ